MLHQRFTSPRTGVVKPGKFVFHKVYTPTYGSPFYAQRREWRMLARVDPLHEAGRLQGRAAPHRETREEALRREVQALYRTTWIGTPFDLTRVGRRSLRQPNRSHPGGEAARRPPEAGLGASQLHVPLLLNFRDPSRSWLPDPVAACCGFGEDSPDTTVYVPFYCATPPCPSPSRRQARRVRPNTASGLPDREQLASSL
jgi:dipeptidase